MKASTKVIKKRNKVIDSAAQSPAVLKSPSTETLASALFSPTLRSPKAKRTKIDPKLIRSPVIISPSASTLGLNSSSVSKQDTLLEGVFGSPSSVLSATSKLTREQRQASFEQWLKAATANKINSKNSWSLPLIDCLSDMTLLKDNNNDINFQKASSTIDGCVKIYSSRVESVAVDTSKLLTGLSAPTSLVSVTSENKREQEEYNLKNIDNEDRSGQSRFSSKIIKKKLGKTSETLVKTFESINIKTFDPDSALDPLFKKMSAEFDEGGFKGLLLNRLSIDNSGAFLLDPNRLVFETGSSSDKLSGPADSMNTQCDEKTSHIIDSFLRTMSLSEMQTICPSLEAFQKKYLDIDPIEPFEIHETIDEILQHLQLNASDISSSKYEADHMQPITDQTFTTTQSMMEPEYPVTLEAFEDSMEFSASNDDNVELGGADTLEQMVQNSPSPLSVTSSNVTHEVKMQNEDSKSRSTLFAYFDSIAHRNWAGPDHWKLSYSLGTKTPNKPARETKKQAAQQVVSVDFCSLPEIDIRDLFSKPTQLSSIALAPEILLSEKNRTKNMLPEDLRISSKDLFSLFFKPDWLFLAEASSSKVLQPSEEIDATAIKLIKNGDFQLADKGLISLISPETCPMQSYSNDTLEGDDDDEAFEPFSVPFELESELPQSTAQTEGETDIALFSQLSIGDSLQSPDSFDALIGSPKFLRIDPIKSYSRVAKRVNMHRLKAVMWSALSRTKERTATLSQIIKLIDSKSTGHERERSEITFPYYFISLLHLANEHTLDLSLTSMGTDISISTE